MKAVNNYQKLNSLNSWDIFCPNAPKQPKGHRPSDFRLYLDC